MTPHWLTNEEKMAITYGLRRSKFYKGLYEDTFTHYWYFSDESYSELNGPYKHRGAAKAALDLYCETL